MPDSDLPRTLKPDAADLPDTTAPEAEASTEEAPRLDLREYELQERLGGGGMGDVYRAGDPALGRDLAVKILKADLQGHPSAEQRFLREARITGSLQHPGIVPIHNLGRLADGRLHYTMRLVRGRTLAEILRDEAGRFERLPSLLMIFEKVCQAMAYAHSKQVIHRDLKPSNVMVGRFGEVQVMDWGLAKLLTAVGQAFQPNADEPIGTRIYTEAVDTPLQQTLAGREMGTPGYMPPEQALGEWDAVDERADVFALGAILCEILTGRPPYGGGGSEALRKAKRGELKEAWTQLEHSDTDAALRELCRDCLAPVREDRPRDAEQVAQRVAAYQAEVQARLQRAELERAAAQVKAGEERKRRRWMLAAVLLLLIGATVSTWLALRARDAEGKARANESLALASADAERGAKQQAEQAAEAERRANQLAQNRLGQIEKANDVLTSIFRDLDPRAEEKGGPSLRQQLSGRLERAATQVEEAAVGDPLAAARVQTALGLSLINLGQAKLARQILSKAEPILAAKLGPDHDDTLRCRTALANAYWSSGRNSEAIGLQEKLLRQMESKFGAGHRGAIKARNNLAVMYQSAGQTAKAIPLFEKTFRQYQAELGSDHVDTSISRNNLATAYCSVGRAVEAVPLFEQTLRQMEAKRGAGHPDTLVARNNLAVAYQSAGRGKNAIPLLEENCKQFEAKLGPAHHDTLVARNNLAEMNLTVGRTDVAVRLHEQNLRQMEAKLEPDHPDTLVSRCNLANAYLSAGRTTDAVRLFQQAVPRMEKKLGPDHPKTLLAMAGLGSALGRDAERLKEAVSLLEAVLERGRHRPDGLPPTLAWMRGTLADFYDRVGEFDKAEVIYRDLVRQNQRQFGSDHPVTAGVLIQLGANLLKQKKCADAEPLLRQCLAIREKQQSKAWNTYNTRSVLGEALLGQKKYAEAEPLLLQGYQGMNQRRDTIPPAYRALRLREALERIVRLYETTNQKDKAAQWRKKLQEEKNAKANEPEVRP